MVHSIWQELSRGLPINSSWVEALVVSSLLALSFAWIRQQSKPSKVEVANESPRIANGQELVRKKPGEVRLIKILVHPIKSCRGTSVQNAKYTPEGIENDRKWCFIDAKTHKVLTARELPTMMLIDPQIQEDDNSPHGGSLVITIPEKPQPIVLSIPLQPSEEVLKSWSIVGDIAMWDHSGIDGYIVQCLPSASSPSDPTPNPSEIFSRYFSREVLLVAKGPRPRICTPTTTFPKLQASVVYQDGYPLLIMSQENMVDMNSWIQDMISEGETTGRRLIGDEWRSGVLNVERFRPNLVFTGAGAYAEDDWEEIAIGHTKEEAQSEDTPVITLVSKCQRCLLPNVSPETGIRDKAVPYKVMMKHRINVDRVDKLKPCMGVNGTPKSDGVFRVGDWVDVRRFERI